MVVFRCWACGREFSLGDEYHGRKGKCPECGDKLMEIQPDTVVFPPDLAVPIPTGNTNGASRIEYVYPVKNSRGTAVMVFQLLLLAVLIAGLCGAIYAAITIMDYDGIGTPRGASAMAQQTVLKNLLCPSTAKFGGITVKDMGDGYYMVRGYCDSQNGFGAMVRRNFECKVSCLSGGGWYGNPPTFDVNLP